MRSTFRFLIAILAFVSLSGCGSFPKQPFNAEAHSDINIIALANVGTPDGVAVRMLNHPGDNFGLVGVLIAEGDMASKTDRFEDSIAERGYDYVRHFTETLSNRLDNMGYQTRRVRVEREGDRDEFAQSYDVSRVDAVLDVYVTYFGYAAAGATTDYRPSFHIAARLVRPAEETVAFVDRIHFNQFSEHSNAIVLDSEPEYAFHDFEELMADPERSIEGLRIAVAQVAKTLAKQFR